MDREKLDELVKAAFKEALAYNQNPEKQAGLLPNNLSNNQRAEVEAVLTQDHSSNAQLQKATQEIIAHFIDEGTKTPASGEGRQTYLSGAPGSKQLLRAAAADASNTAPHIVALRAALSSGVGFDFEEAKRLFTEKTGESLDGYKYAKFRGLMSGMDVAVRGHAQAENLDRIVDSAMPPLTADRNVQIFAIALTPDQTAAEAAKLGIPPEEAKNYAKRFAEYFEKVRESGPDITLLDDKLNPIFVRKDGKAVALPEPNKCGVAYWLSSFNPPQAGSSAPYPSNECGPVAITR